MRASAFEPTGQTGNRKPLIKGVLPVYDPVESQGANENKPEVGSGLYLNLFPRTNTYPSGLGSGLKEGEPK